MLHTYVRLFASGLVFGLVALAWPGAPGAMAQAVAAKETAAYRSPYDVVFTTPIAQLIGDLERSERGDPRLESEIPFEHWYSRKTLERWGSWGPPARIYPPPRGAWEWPVERKRERVIAVALKFQGYEYQHHHVPDWNPPSDWPWMKVKAGHNGRGVDCSNFTGFVYNQGFGLHVTGDVHRQSELRFAEGPGPERKTPMHRLELPDAYKDRIAALRTGDLLYVRASPEGKISHVVLWVGAIGKSPDGTPLIIDSHGDGRAATARASIFPKGCGSVRSARIRGTTIARTTRCGFFVRLRGEPALEPGKDDDVAGLEGKVAVVTGASRAIGRAIAERLASDGAAVVVNYARGKADAVDVVRGITANGGRALAVQADLGSVADVRRLFHEAMEALGRLDILVNNAAVYRQAGLSEVTEDDYDSVFNLNVRGVLFALSEAARRMEKGGRIINISSDLSVQPDLERSIYGASKAAVDHMTRVAAKELGHRGITVNSVLPGPTVPGMFALAPEAIQQAAAKRSPAGRLGTPRDVADVVAFLASEESRWVTGQVILATGGG